MQKDKYINLINKKIAILGFGINNQKLFSWLVKHNAKNITICDKNPKLKIKNTKFKPQFQLGENYLKNLNNFDIIFRTPGIPYLHSEIQTAQKKGTLISSQTKLFFDLCPAKIIGITGTKGKGTTSTLISEILKNSFQEKHKIKSKTKIYLAGNIGKDPFEFLDILTVSDWVILELSSFQLQDLDVGPHIAVILNITSDHLDYHKNTKEYIQAKTSIIKYQKKDDFAVINIDYLTSFKFAEFSKSKDVYYFSRRKSVDLGAYIEWGLKGQGAHSGKIILRTLKNDYEICKTYDIALRGEHNLENICAAVTTSYLAGAKIDSIKKIIKKFKGLEHRIEFFYENNGTKFYDDSASTNPDTTIAAIKSFSEPIILIAGGSSKGADYSNLGREINKSTVKTIIILGETGPEIIKAIKSKKTATNKKIKIINNCKNIKEAVAAAKKEARSGDAVLLSPASASFGLFRNYKDRGEQYKIEVRKS